MRPSERPGSEEVPASGGVGAGATHSVSSARQDLIGGVLAIAFGAFILDKALGYPLGSALRMGPGFFPVVLAALIVVLGVALALGALRRRPQPPRPDIRLRPVVTISLAIVLFGLMIERYGLAPATVALVLISSLAGSRPRPWRALIVAAVTTAAVYVIFIVILQMPFAVARW